MEIVVQGTVYDQDGYPFLRVLLDGDVADIFVEQKLLHRGLVWVGRHRDDIEATVPLAPDGEGEATETVEGLSDDEQLVSAVRDWLVAMNTGEEVDELDDYDRAPVGVPSVRE